MRRFASALILLHLAAITSAPCAFPPPTSDLSRAIHEWFDPYTRATGFNNGYRFFAPDPPFRNHLVEYEYVLADGGAGEGRFPSRTEHWPRLLYHRYFMLSESVFRVCDILPEQTAEPVNDPAAAEEFARYQKDRTEQLARAAALLEGIGTRVLKDEGAKKVTLYLAARDVPAPGEVLDGVPLDDARYFRRWKLGELTSGGAWTWSEEYREAYRRPLP